MKPRPEATPRRARGFFAASDYARGAQKACFAKRGFAEARVLTDWALAVGPEIAAYTTPLKLTAPRGRDRSRGGTLHLGVAPARALEAQHCAPLILERVNQYYGYKAAARLTLVQGAGPEPKRRPPQPPRPDRRHAAQAAKAVGDVASDRLREALVRLGAEIAARTEESPPSHPQTGDVR